MSPTATTTVNHLSADLWCDIADFLPKTSRALLAVALTAPPASFRESGWKGQSNAISRAIIAKAKSGVLTDTILDELCEEEEGRLNGGKHFPKRIIYRRHNSSRFNFRESLAEQIKQYYDSEWEMMDFVDIPKSLASRLSDNDVGAVLVCIGAVNNLKRLKLTNCVNVVGTCLDPLRRSKVLEYLDLELVRQFERPCSGNRLNSVGREFNETKLVEWPVLDVLDDILSLDGNSLKRLQYIPTNGTTTTMNSKQSVIDAYASL